MSRRSIVARSGFTLVELLVVIAIIGILVALLLPAVQAAREAARRMQCGNHVHQWGIAMHNYHDTYKTFPAAGYNAHPRCAVPGCSPARLCRNRSLTWRTSWVISVLPYMEQQPLYDQFDMQNPNGVYAQNNLNLVATDLATFECPSDGFQESTGFRPNNRRINPFMDKGNYVSFYGVDDAFSCNDFRRVSGPRAHRSIMDIAHSKGAKIAEVLDGTSNVALLSETLTSPEETDCRGVWGHAPCMGLSLGEDTPMRRTTTYGGPNADTRESCNHRDRPPYCARPSGTSGCGRNADPQLGCSDASNSINTRMHPRSRHPGGVMLGLADASTRFLAETIDKRVLAELISISSGQPFLSEF